MVKCFFCGKQIQKGTGKIFVKKDGTLYNFCSNKCEKNTLKLKRSPTKIKWTAKYHAAKKQRTKGEKK